MWHSTTSSRWTVSASRGADSFSASRPKNGARIKDEKSQERMRLDPRKASRLLRASGSGPRIQPGMRFTMLNPRGDSDDVWASTYSQTRFRAAVLLAAYLRMGGASSEMGDGVGWVASAVRVGTSSPLPDMTAWFAGSLRRTRSNGRMLATDAVKTMRLMDGVASAASRMALFPATAWDTRSPGLVASGDATWTIYEQSLAASR